MTESAMLPADEWQRVFNIRVTDSAGWVLDGVSWQQELSANEFIRLLGTSTFEPHTWEES